jgi:adenylate cyclase
MLVCPDTAKLVDAMLALGEAAERDATMPQLRIGIASGWAVSRARDWFGSPVNVASRVTEIAQPGAVLVAGSARYEVSDAEDFLWSFAESRRLKGVAGQTDLFRVHRTAEMTASSRDSGPRLQHTRHHRLIRGATSFPSSVGVTCVASATRAAP